MRVLLILFATLLGAEPALADCELIPNPPAETNGASTGGPTLVFSGVGAHFNYDGKGAGGWIEQTLTPIFPLESTIKVKVIGYEDGGGAGNHDFKIEMWSHLPPRRVVHTRTFTILDGERKTEEYSFTLGPGEIAAYARITNTGVTNTVNSDGVISHFSVTAVSPEIRVTSSEGGVLGDGGTDSHGDVIAGIAKTVTYTVENIGICENQDLRVDQAQSSDLSTNVTVNSISAPSSTSVRENWRSTSTSTVRYTPTTVGSFLFKLSIGNNDIDEDPFGITVRGTVVTGSASLTKSTIAAAPDSIIADGSTTSAISVQLKDANDNPLTASGGTITLTSTKGSIGAVTDNLDGTYTATLTSQTTAATATISGTLAGSDLDKKATVTFTAGSASLTKSTIAAAPDSIIADGSTTSAITVQLKDANDNPLTASGGIVTLTPTKGSIGAVTDNLDGTYTATLTSQTTAATATITGTLGGSAITDDASVTFTAGTASLTKSTITANPVSILADGSTTSTITVQLKDANDNNLAASGGAVTLGTTKGSIGAVTDNLDGTYTATLTSQITAGTATITGTLGSSAITDDASVTFTAGTASLTKSTITASPVSIIADGSTTSTITVQLKDANDNHLAASGGAVTLGTTKGSIGAVTDNLDGTYTATLTSAITAGTATITGTLGSSAITDDASVTFTAGTASLTKSTITASPVSIIADGSTTSTITVQLKDANDNHLAASGGAVTLGTTKGSIGAVTDNLDGTYTATLTSAITAGTATITGTLGSSAITDDASVTFTAGTASLTKSTITASPVSIIADGSTTSTITVQLKDANDNHLTASGGTVTLGTTKGSIGAVTDNLDGTYTATLTSAITAGTSTISGKLAGSDLDKKADVIFTGDPGIDVVGNNISIPASNGSPDLNNHTDFGDVLFPTGNVTRTFTINNTGNAVLTLGASVSISGAAASDFTVVTQPAASVAPGTSTNIVVSFAPSAVGVRGATLLIVNNVAGKNPYDFPISGNGTSNGKITIVQQILGPDVSVGFTSPQAALNFTLTTVNGSASQEMNAIAAGSYTVTAADLSSSGYGINSIFCSDSDSTTDIASRTATIVLDTNEEVTCTFETFETREHTSKLISNYLGTRNSLLLANQPDINRRFERLTGEKDENVSSDYSNSLNTLRPLTARLSRDKLSFNTSLSRITNTNSAWEFWAEGRVVRFESSGKDEGGFGVLYDGVDYRLNDDTLVGVMFQYDWFEQVTPGVNGPRVDGRGWMIGPYGLWRLAENLYFDARAAWGGSANKIKPFNTYEDEFDTERWLLSAAWIGEYEHQNWTLRPGVSLQYISENQISYTDSLGIFIPGQTVSQGDIRFGPRLSYNHLSGDGTTVTPWLEFDGVYSFTKEGRFSHGTFANDLDGFSGSFKAGLDVANVKGAKLSFSGQLDGLGADAPSYGGAFKLAIPFR